MPSQEREKELADYKKLLETESGDPMSTALHQSGYVLALNRLGRHQEVVDFCSGIGDLYHALSHLRHILAESLIELKRYDEAIKILKEDIDRVPIPYDACLYYTLADAYAASGRQSEAVEAYQAAQKIEHDGNLAGIEETITMTREFPDDPEFRHELAQRLAGIQDFPRAVEAIREAIRLNPYDPEYHAELAEYQKKLTGSRS